jgi:integrase
MNITKKLTKRQVESVEPHAQQEVFVWDSELKGFGLRVFPTGRRTYFVQYRNQFARTRRKKIGVHGILTAEQAREEAKKILGDVAKGDDPSENRGIAQSKKNMAELAHEYLEVYAKLHKGQKSCKDDERRINNVILLKLGTKKIEEVTSKCLQELHREFKDRPYEANRLMALLSKMFSLAIQWRWISENPAKGVEKYHEEKRQRWLNDEELDRLLKVLAQYHNQDVPNVIRLLILTGSRMSEVLNAVWEQFDLQKGVWSKPSHSTKQKRFEHVPLSSQTLQLLFKMKKSSNSIFLFPGKVEGKPIHTIKKAWHTIRTRAELPEVRLHDLRHAYASHLVSSGLSLSIVGKLLGHTQAATTQRYAHLADEPLRAATEVFGQKVGKMKVKSV